MGEKMGEKPAKGTKKKKNAANDTGEKPEARRRKHLKKVMHKEFQCY